MTNLKNAVALGATMALVAFSHPSMAQEDLDNLLRDLESEEETTVTSVDAPEVAEDAEEPAAEEEPVAAEEPTEADTSEVADEPEPSAEPEPAVEPEPAAAEPEPTEEPESTAEEPTEESAEEPEPTVDEPTEEPEPAAEEPEPAVEEPAEEPESSVEEPAEEPLPTAEELVDEPEPAVEEPAEEPLPTAEELVEEPKPAVEEPAEEPEPAVEEPAEEPEPASEEPAEVPEPASEEPATVTESEESDSILKVLSETAGEVPVKTDAPAPTPVPAPEPVAIVPEKDRELIEYIRTTEELRRKAFDTQAHREYSQAEQYMAAGEYKEAAKHYRIAEKLLNDSPKMSSLLKLCQSGTAEALYKAALQEDESGLRARAIKLMKKAKECRHPKARRQLEIWLTSEDPNARKSDVSELTHRRNEESYKAEREKNLRLLRRSRQLLATRELSAALDQCELVLDTDPYNEEALHLREIIMKKRRTILKEERKATREGMIADVDRAWRPIYAVDAREVSKTRSETLKTPLGDDPDRRQEQDIIKRMKEMRLPAISFKPPATIIDAVEFFRGASKDFDRPDIPLEQRGFNFVLKTPEALRTASTGGNDEEESEGFGDNDEGESNDSGAASGVPIIPMITASDITFFEALKLVCESVDYKFKVQGPIVMVMHKDMSTDEMVTRSYPVVTAFMDRMETASSDMKEMKASGFGGGSRNNDDDGEERKERDWKEFFELLGVRWPEGSSIMYIKTIGKLRVKNTYENLAELEKALTEMNADPKLIEIEARFVEVCQEDLNSLGFEWILNSDYSLGLGSHVSRALGVRRGTWGTTTTSTTSGSSSGTTGSSIGNETVGGVPTQNNGGTTVNTTGNGADASASYASSNGASWIRDRTSTNHGNLGVNGIGGQSEYSTNMRYLSTMGNHINGEGVSTNDQFMRVNAFLGGMDLSMILHMLSQRSDTDLLSAPKVLTRPGQEAVIKVVTEYIYPTDYDVQLQSSSSSSSSSGSSQSAILAVVEPQSFTMREVGVILDVTPSLTDDGNLIELELNTQVVDEPTWKNYGMKIPFTGNSSLQNFEGIGGIFEGLAGVLDSIGTGIGDSMKAAFAERAVSSASAALDSLTSNSSENITYYEAPMEQPFFHIRSISSSVSVYPGATIVMGGLITEQRKSMDDKIPLLGDLPFIGRLFRSHSELTSKRNLLIFVTTRLVDVRGREVKVGSLEAQSDQVLAAPEEEGED